MSYQFQATEKFWKEFYALSPEQKEAVRAKWETFKADLSSHFRYAHYLAFVRYCKASDLLRRYREGSTDYVPHRRKPGHQSQGWDSQNLLMMGSAQETEIYERYPAKLPEEIREFLADHLYEGDKLSARDDFQLLRPDLRTEILAKHGIQIILILEKGRVIEPDHVCGSVFLWSISSSEF